jgi:hypothetical protein
MNPKLMVVVLGALLTIPQAQVGNGKRDYKALKRDLEVMRRILEREARPPAVRDTSLSNMFALGRGEALSEAYYVPGQGALFVLRLSSWIDSKPQPAEDEADAPEKSLWNDIRAEVEGRPSRQNVRVDVRYAHALSTSDVETRVLDALARYAGNIGQLTDDERITVIVLGGTPAPDPSQPQNWPGSGAGEGATMVVQVRRGDAGGKLTAEEVRKRATVTVY